MGFVKYRVFVRTTGSMNKEELRKYIQNGVSHFDNVQSVVVERFLDVVPNKKYRKNQKKNKLSYLTWD